MNQEHTTVAIQGYNTMKFVEKYAELSDRFAIKYAQDISVSQSGTTELFFTNDGNQRAFASAAQKAVMNSPKAMVFDLKASAEPNKGAKWILTPPSAQTIFPILDAEFKKVMGKGMREQQVIADKAAKGGAGSGTLDIASLTAE